MDSFMESSSINEGQVNREDYVSGKILQVGDTVQDVNTGEVFQILDRGPNYIKVAKEDGGFERKWLTEVKVSEEQEPVKKEPVIQKNIFEFAGYKASNISIEDAKLLQEQFEFTEDHFAYRQAIVNLDKALVETSSEKRYEYLSKVEEFYNNMKLDLPLIVEVEKNSLEQKRVAFMIAAIAEVPVSDKGPNDTVRNAIQALLAKKITKLQWQIIAPVFKIAKDFGIIVRLSGAPIKLEESVFDSLFDIIEENFDEMVEELEYEDLAECFGVEEELEESEELLSEVLSFDKRQKLSNLLRTRSKVLAVRRERAEQRSASNATLIARARRLANTMLKRRMFRKDPSELSRSEKERFEQAASKRKALVARLAQKLLPKVRMLQQQRMSRV